MTTAPHSPDELGFDMADRMRKAREVAGLTQSEIADLIHVSRTTASNYESRQTAPHRSHRIAWAMACGVPDAWLTSGEWPTGGGEAGSPNAPYTANGVLRLVAA